MRNCREMMRIHPTLLCHSACHVLGTTAMWERHPSAETCLFFHLSFSRSLSCLYSALICLKAKRGASERERERERGYERKKKKKMLIFPCEGWKRLSYDSSETIVLLGGSSDYRCTRKMASKLHELRGTFDSSLHSTTILFVVVVQWVIHLLATPH